MNQNNIISRNMVLKFGFNKKEISLILGVTNEQLTTILNWMNIEIKYNHNRRDGMERNIMLITKLKKRDNKSNKEIAKILKTSTFIVNFLLSNQKIINFDVISKIEENVVEQFANLNHI